jgi:GSCFA family
VRYIRDGLVENNISKARLIEVVQHLVNKFDRLHYFPSYELVNDVLRDYRFFKADMVHPSDQAIDYVFEAFAQACFNQETLRISTEIQQLVNGINHRPLHPETAAHIAFKENLLLKMKELEARFNHLDFQKEKQLLGAR